jgi:hypothetical protein
MGEAREAEEKHPRKNISSFSRRDSRGSFFDLACVEANWPWRSMWAEVTLRSTSQPSSLKVLDFDFDFTIHKISITAYEDRQIVSAESAIPAGGSIDPIFDQDCCFPAKKSKTKVSLLPRAQLA